MPPENYCYWCGNVHMGQTCKEYADKQRQFYIDNPHSCSRCR